MRRSALSIFGRQFWIVIVAGAFVALLTARSFAAVCDTSAFSCPPTGQCIVTGTWSISDGCTIDFGSRAVELRGTLQAATISGSFAIHAGDLTINGGKIRSLGNTYFPGGQISVDATDTFRMMGTGSRIDASGNGGGGEISLSAEVVSLDAGVVAADGGLGDNCGDAGTIDIEARSGQLSFSSTIHATTPGGDCGGGEISLTGSSVNVSGEIDARGGGWVSDDAIEIDADPGDLVVTTTGWLRADGLGQPDGVGASGGGITLTAELGNVLLAGSVSAAGKSPGGAGGYFLVAAGGTADVRSRVAIPSGGSGIGGTAVVDADGSLSMTGDLIATGGSSGGEGGDITLTSLGDILLSWAFGSVAEHVLRSCASPLLVVRTSGFAKPAGR